MYTRYWWDETCVRQRVVPSAGKLRTHVGACEIRLKLMPLHAAQINKTQNNGQVVGKVTTLRYPHGNLHLHASTIIYIPSTIIWKHHNANALLLHSFLQINLHLESCGFIHDSHDPLLYRHSYDFVRIFHIVQTALEPGPILETHSDSCMCAV